MTCIAGRQIVHVSNYVNQQVDASFTEIPDIRDEIWITLGRHQSILTMILRDF